VNEREKARLAPGGSFFGLENIYLLRIEYQKKSHLFGKARDVEQVSDYQLDNLLLAKFDNLSKCL